MYVKVAGKRVLHFPFQQLGGAPVPYPRSLRNWHVFAALACLFLALSTLAPAAQLRDRAVPVIFTDHGDNSPAQQNKPYVILISLDGFRYDYAQRFGAKNILALAQRGASAPEGMIPVFPSVTFPNHYSIVTGLYP